MTMKNTTTISISISTRDPDLYAQLFQEPQIPGAFSEMEILPIPQKRSLAPFSPEIINFSVRLASKAALGILAKWLWSVLSRSTKIEYITIEKETVEVINEKTILRIVTEKYQSSTHGGKSSTT
jgi:hypothetical protein